MLVAVVILGCHAVSCLECGRLARRDWQDVDGASTGPCSDLKRVLVLPESPTTAARMHDRRPHQTVDKRVMAI